MRPRRTSRPTEGGCLCGAVRYRIAGESLALARCHCRTCRHASGAPSVAWSVFRSGDFVFTAETPVHFHSSPGVVRTFCGKCGTPLTYQRTAEADTIDVTTVTLDDAADFAPTKEVWVEHRLAWETLNDSLEHFPRSSIARANV
jgi:hypothetical protein